MKTAHRQASTAKRRRWAADPHATARRFGVGTTFPPEAQSTMTLPVRIAFERVRTGAGTADDFDHLTSAASMGYLCLDGKDPHAQEVFTRAEHALERMLQRHHAQQRWGLDGPGLQAVADMLPVYEQLASLVMPSEILAAYAEYSRRVARWEAQQ